MKHRHSIVIGNWKLNGNRQMVNNLISTLRQKLANVYNCTIVIAPPEIYLNMAKQAIGNSNIVLGAQNVDVNLSGSFTGETSAAMLKDIGVEYAIIGHSERRIYHKESNELIAKKFVVLKEQDLIPVLCIGESEEENKAGKTKEVCARQIDAILQIQDISVFEGVVIAYEPIWAIGTGKAATPLYIQEVHKFIRSYIAAIDSKITEKVNIQYGGSVNASNAMALFAQPDIDGVLVGSASLDVNIFASIVHAAKAAKNRR